MKKTKLILVNIFALLLFAQGANAQVTIGSGTAPRAGAILDLVEKEIPEEGAVDQTTGVKGIMYPRVELSSATDLFPMFQADGVNYRQGSAKFNKVEQDKKHAGMIVYNLTKDVPFVEGLYIWNGSIWKSMNSTEAKEAIVGSIACGSYSVQNNTLEEAKFFETYLRISYAGGNGASYSGTDPEFLIPGNEIASNGLMIERMPGVLQLGVGEIVYRIFGTPKRSTVAGNAEVTFSVTTLSLTEGGVPIVCNGIKIGGGLTSVNVLNLPLGTGGDNRMSVLINRQHTENIAIDKTNTNLLTFYNNNVKDGMIQLQEPGSYAFSLRLYGRITLSNDPNLEARQPFYIYLVRVNDDGSYDVKDSAELDIMVMLGKVTDYSYSVTLGAAFDRMENAAIVMQCPKIEGPYVPTTWFLRSNTNITSAVRTSMIYWKL